MLHTIQTALQTANTNLTGISETSRLDAELLLAHILKKTRTYLHTWPEKNLTPTEAEDFFCLIKQREKGKPLAYLTGHKEFWSLDFLVTEATLIPRPETELLVELVLDKIKGEKKQIADLGTGCGAIALAIAHEKPSWTVYATDKHLAALAVARSNAERFALKNVVWKEGDWCEALPKMFFDVIVSNPPYLAEDDEHLPGLQHEPRSALVAKERGLEDIQCIIQQAKSFLKLDGYLMLEHGCLQGSSVREFFMKYGYAQIQTINDIAGLERVTIGAKLDK